jgi:hypothetical protein
MRGLTRMSLGARGRGPRAAALGAFLALVLISPAAAAPAAPGPGDPPAPAVVYTDVATMVGWDVGGGEVRFGTIRLDTTVNSKKQFTKQTLRFAMRGLAVSETHLVKIFQGTCDDADRHYLISSRVLTNAAGRLTSTVTLTATQRAIMRHLVGEHPAVSIVVLDVEPSTGVSAPCGELWAET